MKERIPCEHAVWIGGTSMGTEMCPHEADRFFYSPKTGEAGATCSIGDGRHATAWSASDFFSPISREEYVILQVLSS